MWNYRKYVFIGPKCSGKTVLLASLIDNLRKNHEHFLREAEYSALEVMETPKKWTKFPLDQILSGIANSADWPNQTYEPNAIRIKATPKSFFNRTLTRDFIDLPGELFSDFLGSNPESALQTFESWSNAILEKFPLHEDEPSKKDIDGYCAIFKRKEPPSADELIQHYHDILKAGVENRYRYLCSPSTILNHGNGWYSNETIPDKFAPLPHRFGSVFDGLRNQFKDEFERYQKSIINPLRELLGQADAVIIPVDVSWMLSAGMATFHDQRNLSQALAIYLKQLQGFLQLFYSTNRWLGGEGATVLKRVVICGTKLDVFAPECRSHLESLVRDFTKDISNSAGLAKVDVKYTTCSAMVSCRPVEGKSHLLKGYVNGERQEFKPTPLPKTWPEFWQQGEYRFADHFDPRLAKNLLYPPLHHNLEDLMNILES